MNSLGGKDGTMGCLVVPAQLQLFLGQGTANSASLSPRDLESGDVESDLPGLEGRAMASMMGIKARRGSRNTSNGT